MAGEVERKPGEHVGLEWKGRRRFKEDGVINCEMPHIR